MDCGWWGQKSEKTDNLAQPAEIGSLEAPLFSMRWDFCYRLRVHVAPAWGSPCPPARGDKDAVLPMHLGPRGPVSPSPIHRHTQEAHLKIHRDVLKLEFAVQVQLQRDRVHIWRDKKRGILQQKLLGSRKSRTL